MGWQMKKYLLEFKISCAHIYLFEIHVVRELRTLRAQVSVTWASSLFTVISEMYSV